MKVQLPWFGKAAGSSAGTIYQSYWGNTYTRSFPFSFHYPDTTKQQQCQATFFDIQRMWLPIYDRLALNIAPSQRKNKNPFNVMIGKVFRIFNPYGKDKSDTLPSFFGLDNKNRVRPVLYATEIVVTAEHVIISFDMFRPYLEIQIDPRFTYVLLFNLTKQVMMFSIEMFRAGQQRVTLENSQAWNPTDKICMYVALVADNWLGNFNLIPQ